MAEPRAFQAEIRQLLDILVHSLYTEREIFLRELLSNASDALNRAQFEQLTQHDMLDADAEPEIRLAMDGEAGVLTVSDNGIGMARADMEQNLGVIAHSGAKAFVAAMQEGNTTAQDVIGQFGVGFYSVFMVAQRVRVVSRSHLPDERTWAWESGGDETWTIEEAQRERRGTDVIITLRDDAQEFLKPFRLKDIVRRHSDYIAFPIFVGDEGEATNRQTALWRQGARDISAEQYAEFYRTLTLDFGEPRAQLHLRADVPLQFYALLYVPQGDGPNLLGMQRDPGLKLYARKVLIEEATTELLPEWLQFVVGVVDSEDLPLSVSRESVQATRVMARLKQTLTRRLLGELKRLAEDERERYLELWQVFGRYLRQGLAVSEEERESLEALLFFNSTRDDDAESWHSLQDYAGRLAQGQTDIYYILGEDIHSARRSPHLDAFRRRGIEVLYFTDPVDPFMLMGLESYGEHRLRNVDEADIELEGIGDAGDEAEDEQGEALGESAFDALQARFRAVLGERVQEVRASHSLVDSPARLVSAEGAQERYLYRVNRLLEREVELPVRTLELNPRHGLLHNLGGMLAARPQDPLIDATIEQLYETALLQDGLHPDPAAMADRLLLLMEAATGGAAAGAGITPAADAGSDAEAPAAETFDESGDSG
ncbi:MAG: molecular chaperone HtpG [Anaerolineaceae bacterium]|nr:molecular chaperone HtpG [Anaerolineaceae bacterium]